MAINNQLPRWFARRWSAVQISGWFALVLGIIVSYVYEAAGTNHKGVTSPTLLFPYLAASAVYITTCIWILSSVNLGSAYAKGIGSKKSAYVWASIFFLIGLVAMSAAGTAGEQGRNVIRLLNWYLFQEGSMLPADNQWPSAYSSPFNYVAAFANALALACIVFIGVLCKGIDDSSYNTTDVVVVVEQMGKLHSLMILASALMVTSTLTLFLLFASADQIKAAVSAKTENTEAASNSMSNSNFSLICSTTASANEQKCVLTISGEETKKDKSNAAYMATVVGLGFTGVLFILFATCSGSLDDRVHQLMEIDRQVAIKKRCVFNVKDWREQSGAIETAATDKVLKAIALLAPALTGVIALATTT